MAAADIVFAPRLRLSGACQLRIGGRDSSPAQLDLSDADCSSPTILAPVTQDDVRVMRLDPAIINGSMRLVSLRRADVAELTCTDVDLSACRFAGVHHLDALRIEGTSQFSRPPSPRLWPPSQWRWWSAPRVLAEEIDYRVSQQRADGTPKWSGWEPLDADSSDRGEPVSPARLAGLYRALRKSREDAKDEPGAADFYYGEMEMRRHDAERSRAERWIIAAYWALAGYGLRASRAYVALAIVLIAATGILWSAGFVSALPLVDAALYAIGSATPIGGVDPPRALTTVGEAIRLVLRFTGPLLVGFALIALRGRVKR